MIFQLNQILGNEIKIKLIKISPTNKNLSAEIVAVNKFWTEKFGKKVAIGKKLTLNQRVGEGNEYWWCVDSPKSFPWFILMPDGRFEHYKNLPFEMDN